MPSSTTPAAESGSALWAPDRRVPTLALILLVTLAAFEAMSVGTALPTLVAELGGQDLYSWPFTSFLAASVIGTVLSGRVCDRLGPVPSLVVAPGLFFAGLVVAGVADNMWVLLVGRVLQGAGAGAQIVALYVMVALVYPERDRPAAFGALSAAWVVPSLVGPGLAGLATELLSWRVVFLGLAPLVLIGWLLLIPVVKTLRARPDAVPEQPDAPRKGLPLAAVCAAVGLSALTWAAEHPQLSSLFLGLGGLVLLAPSLRRLLPPGTLRGKSGLPVVVLSRGLLSGSFFAVQAYIPLVLSNVHGYSPTLAGVPLTVGSLGWSAAAAWQARQRDVQSEVMIRRGFLLLAVALAGAVLIAPAWGPAWLIYPLWAIAGFGMGTAMPNIAVRVLALSTPGDRGFNGAAAQVCDMFGSAALIGLGGVLVGAIASASQPTAAVIPLDLVMAGFALLGAALISRNVTKS
ncbi:MFS transporter [Allokutzneria sp. NRRL B-24872]|uniref:MFS transporter n=1 Tax=Allokutzneria sp. NRRL B-24872 TaxID=1137961 RepID=UPI001FEF214B|nr:MFS transporter [Allokutzneria sp. NRRL B-24872]